MLKSVYIEWVEADISEKVLTIDKLDSIEIRKKAIAHAILVHENKERVILTPAVVDNRCIHLLIIPKKCITVFKEVDLKKGFIEKKKRVKKTNNSKKEKTNNETKKSK